VTQYPSPMEDANLKSMITLREKFKLNVGYSDHSVGDLIPIASVALGACVIEKHLTLDQTSEGPDHLHSMDSESFKNMVNNIRLLEHAMGDGIKKIEKSERDTRIIQRRSIFTIKTINKGEKFTRENIACLRPAIGLPASSFYKILNKRARKKISSFTPITKSCF